MTHRQQHQENHFDAANLHRKAARAHARAGAAHHAYANTKEGYQRDPDNLQPDALAKAQEASDEASMVTQHAVRASHKTAPYAPDEVGAAFEARNAANVLRSGIQSTGTTYLDPGLQHQRAAIAHRAAAAEHESSAADEQQQAYNAAYEMPY